MCRWVVLGEVVIGTLEAADRPQAERLALAQFGRGGLARVQSEASWAVAEEERRAAQERRRLVFEARGG